MIARRHSLLTRRRLLAGAGALGMACPLLSMLGRAGGASPAKRLIVYCSPNEPIDRDHWLPAGNGDEFALTSLPPMMAALEPYRSKLLLVGDLDMQSRMDDPHSGGHIGMGHLLVGRRVTELSADEPDHWASGISVDQHIAQARGVDALCLGVRVGGANGNGRLSYLGDSQPVDPIERPDDAFDALFAEATLPAEELAALKAQRLSVLDRVSGDLDALAPKLATEDRLKLEIHSDMVRDLELKIQNDAVVDCEPTAPAAMDYGSNDSFPLAVRRQIDVMVQALGCGITDVASLQVANSGASNLTPIWPEEGIDLNIDYHNIAHDFNTNENATTRARREEIETFMFGFFAYLLQQLEAIPEGTGGTMLDNSLVVWMKPIARAHNFEKFLFILAGSAGGQLETGRFLSFAGRPHNDLLVSLCNLMGLQDETFGDPEYCTGPLTL
jgi:hypothetical protein